jgi:dTDP-4-amino-4,6-dideoxygalactose transaminase
VFLTLKELGVGPGDYVLVSTFTFAASANPVVHLGATPVFIDSDPETWNISPALATEELASGRRFKAAVIVDLYGQCADYGYLLPLFADAGVPVFSDAAEALGASYGDQPAGSFGTAAALSFNGNKIITTSGGGMLLTNDASMAARVRHLATQAREPVPHYEHVEAGYNERLSNLLAAFGRGQLADLDRRVTRRRAIFDRYVSILAGVSGVGFQPEAPYGMSNRWLTCMTLEPGEAKATPEQVRVHLEAHNIEARPTWKPMHLQPVFADAPCRVDGTSQRIFETGLCLPSGSSLTDADQDRVIDAIHDLLG